MAASCVRVDPPLVAFKDVEVGQVYKIQVTAANVGKTSRNIMMGKPKLKVRDTRSNLIFYSSVFQQLTHHQSLPLLIKTKWMNLCSVLLSFLFKGDWFETSVILLTRSVFSLAVV